MNRYEQLQHRLANDPRGWLVTGVAGFIGSNLLETLLKLNQQVVGLDNFATGKQANLDDVAEDLRSGAVVLLDDERIRIRTLPLRPD